MGPLMLKLAQNITLLQNYLWSYWFWGGFGLAVAAEGTKSIRDIIGKGEILMIQSHGLVF